MPDDRRTIAAARRVRAHRGRSPRGRVQPATTVLGSGDDAAVVAAPDGRVVATTDVLVEGVHFRLDWSTPEQVGRKAAAANLADVAAMGAVPTALLVGLRRPADTPVATVAGLADGLWAEAAVVGAGLVGGDVVTSAHAHAGGDGARVARGAGAGHPGRGAAGRRRRARGRLGWAAAGLAVLQRGSGRRAWWSRPTGCRSRRTPPGPAAAVAGATAMIDVSDGLLADLGHIAAASGVRDRPERRPERAAEAGRGRRRAGRRPAVVGAHRRRGPRARSDLPPDAALPTGFVPIGEVRAGDAAVLIEGEPYDGDPGWTHFA